MPGAAQNKTNYEEMMVFLCTDFMPLWCLPIMPNGPVTRICTERTCAFFGACFDAQRESQHLREQLLEALFYTSLKQ